MLPSGKSGISTWKAVYGIDGRESSFIIDSPEQECRIEVFSLGIGKRGCGRHAFKWDGHGLFFCSSTFYSIVIFASFAIQLQNIFCFNACLDNLVVKNGT